MLTRMIRESKEGKTMEIKEEKIEEKGKIRQTRAMVIVIRIKIKRIIMIIVRITKATMIKLQEKEIGAIVIECHNY